MFVERPIGAIPPIRFNDLERPCHDGFLNVLVEPRAVHSQSGCTSPGYAAVWALDTIFFLDRFCKPVGITRQTTPAGRMVFTVLSAVAELERSLIAERVRAGLRNARAKGRRLGRPRVAVDAVRIGRLRAQGRSVHEIAGDLGCIPAASSTRLLRIGGRLALQTEPTSD
jgi:hypothetical protein